MSSNLVTIEDEAHFEKVVAALPPRSPCVLYFFATWAEQCKQMDDVVSELATQNPDLMFLRVGRLRELRNGMEADLSGFRTLPDRLGSRSRPRMSRMFRKSLKSMPFRWLLCSGDGNRSRNAFPAPTLRLSLLPSPRPRNWPRQLLLHLHRAHQRKRRTLRRPTRTSGSRSWFRSMK